MRCCGYILLSSLIWAIWLSGFIDYREQALIEWKRRDACLKGMKSVMYMGLALGMLFYAVPRLDIRSGLTLPTVFGVIWVLFALMIVAAHLHELIGVDERKKQEIGRVKRMKGWQMEQMLSGRRKLMQFKK